MDDKKLKKLEFLRDGFWHLFEQTGNVQHYGRYKGAVQLINERKQELSQQNEKY